MTQVILRPREGNARKDWALMYAALGWKVFPVWSVAGDPLACACDRGSRCDRPGKHPLGELVPSGVSDASSERGKVEAWWAAHPDANIGIATGAVSGLTVVDADTGDGKPGLINLTRLCAPNDGVPQTFTVRTGGGGLHLYFRYSAELRTGTDVLDEAIDVRSDGGYAVAPPSNHLRGDYTWQSETGELKELPQWMVAAPEQARQRRARRRGRPRTREPLALDQAEAMLQHVGSSDRDKWLKVGLILGREFVGTNTEGEAWNLYEAWAARSDKFDENRGENIVRMREQFYEASQQPPRAGGERLGVGTLRMWAVEGGYVPTPEIRDADHYTLASALVAAIEQETGARPVYAMGYLWRVEDALWHAWTVDQVALSVGERFRGGKYCRRRSDFLSVAQVATGIVAEERFFAEAPVGIAAPGGFWYVAPDGSVRNEPLSAEHRQRMRLAADPVAGGRPERLLAVLAEAFEGHDPEGQTRLLQQLTGCALTRSLWRHRIVALLFGATSSGKSTFLNVLRAAFPRDLIAATSPARWGNEYYVATLAGKALNIVGELDGDQPIPSGAFKSITGRDLIDGRHPTHRPFSFVSEAAHFFNSNRTPPTTDRDDAFFRRWRILHFANAVPAARERRDLDEQIIASEFGQFLGWALDGAASVAREGGIIETAAHRAALARWRVGNNSALEFLLDVEHCSLLPEASTAGQALYDRYREWASAAGVRAFGRSGFYDALERGGGIARVQVARREHQVIVDGVHLKTAGF